MSERSHHPNCYQTTGVPDGMPDGICDCEVLRVLDLAYKADAAERRAEEAEYHVEQLRDALEGAERRLEAIESLAAEWDSEGRGLVEHCESPRDVHEGQALQRCAYETREIFGTKVAR